MVKEMEKGNNRIMVVNQNLKENIYLGKEKKAFILIVMIIN